MQKLALISVSDKTDIVDFAKRLNQNDYKIIATGGTAKLLLENDLDCEKIEDYAPFPEVFSGRVKTLQPQVFGGILMRRENESDIKEAQENQIYPIDIVCVNLYPFPKVVNDESSSLEDKIENVDIGGPSLIRAAAKNYKDVSVLTNPNQYEEFLTELEKGEISEATKRKLAAKAFSHTSFYDTVIANFFEKEFELPKDALRLNYKVQNKLRYGENPHQEAYLSGDFYDYFEVLHGKELSYNNIVDLSGAVELAMELGETSCSIIKHTNPAGAAKAGTVYDAYVKALSCDPVSSFGGIVVFTKKVDAQTAEKLNEMFLEIVAAPDFDEDALDILKKKKNRRLLKVLKEMNKSELQVKNVPGGLIVQDKDNSNINDLEMKLVTDREYSDAELEDLKFAWIVCKHTKSNTIVYAKDKKAIGVGAGQMSRVDAARIAAGRAKQHGHGLEGAVAASDAFFPFPDGVIEIAEQGVKAIIQPGGSVRDEEVIKAANEREISMIFTGIRNFKH